MRGLNLGDDPAFLTDLRLGPRRLQRSRAKGWRMPEGAVYVGRPTKWGNPVHIRGTGSLAVESDNGILDFDIPVTPAIAVAMFDALWAIRLLVLPGEHPDDVAIREAREAELEELRGKDLVCWCPLDAPCHADVLLALANRPVPDA